MLNVEVKLISKALPEKLKEVLPKFYFLLERDSPQGDAILAFLFLSALENLCFLCADDTTFSLHDTIYTKHMADTFFLYFFGLKLNLTKYEIINIRVLKGIQVAVCAMRSIYLNNETLKTLGTHFSYNEKLKDEKVYCKKIHRVLKILKIRNVTVEVKIVMFKTIAISKIVFQLFLTTASKYILNELKKMQKAFLRKNSVPKIKHETLCNDYKGGRLKKC